MVYNLKIGPAQGLKLKSNAGFNLPLIGRTGIKATKTGGIWYVDFDYTTLTPGPISDPTTAYVAIEDKTAGIYREVSLASLLTSGLDTDLQAIAALTSTGVLVRTADNTWALRTVAGTANEITVTNGDGVSGNPTVSLPAALTFTGKTVTGGTYTNVVSINGNIWTAGTGTLTLGAGKTATINNTLTFTGTDLSSVAFGAGGTVVYTSNNLSVFAATTSAQLAGVISDETGSGALVFGTSPTLVTPTLGAASATSINKVSITAPATGSTLTIADGATLSATATASVSGTNTGDQTITLTGDVTGSGTGSFAATIAANAVTNAKMATVADGTIKSNISGGVATPSDNTISAVLDKLFGAAQGAIIYRGAASWGALGPGTSGNFLKTQGAAGNPVWDSIPGGGDMLSTNNLSDVASASTSLTNLGGTTVGKALFTATDEASARTTLGYKWEPITQDAVTNVASWSATGLSAYRMLRLSLKLRSAVNDAFINFRTSSNNGSSYDATVGDYLTSNLIGNASTATSGGNSESALTLNGSGSTAPLAASHIITLFDFNQAEYCFMQSQGFAISSSNVKTVEMRGAARAQATARNAIQVTLSSGNIATGIFILEGVKG